MLMLRNGLGRIAHGAARALAVIGVALLVSQPICAAEHQDLSADACCASRDVAAVAAAANASSAVGERVALVPLPAHAARTQLAPYFFDPGSAAASPPPLRYYARSARILR